MTGQWPTNIFFGFSFSLVELFLGGRIHRCPRWFVAGLLGTVVLSGVSVVSPSPAWCQVSNAEIAGLHDRAKQAVAGGDLREAERLYRQMVGRAPDRWFVRLVVGDFYYRDMLDCDRALPHYQALADEELTLLPTMAEVFDALLACYESRGRFDEAARAAEGKRKLYRRVRKPHEARRALRRRGINEFRGGHLARADETLTQVLFADYSDVDAHIYRSHARYHQGRLREALEGYQYAKVTFRPRLIDLHIGVCLFRMKRWTAAIEALTASIEVDGEDWYHHRWIALAYDELGDEAAAERALRRALDLGPTGPGLHEISNNLAFMVAERSRPGDPDLLEALELALDAVGATGGTVPAYTDTLAEVYLRLGRVEDAQRWAKRSVRLAPGEPYYVEQLTRIEEYRDGFVNEGGRQWFEQWEMP